MAGSTIGPDGFTSLVIEVCYQGGVTMITHLVCIFAHLYYITRDSQVFVHSSKRSA